MTAKEAAEVTGYTPDYIGRLCREDKLPGACVIGERMWLIPKEAVEAYKPGPQGFAAMQAKKRKHEAAELAERNAAICAAKGLIAAECDNVPNETLNSVNIEYFTVAEVAEILNMSRRYVRHICSSGRVSGAKKSGKEWLIPSVELRRIQAIPRFKRAQVLAQSKQVNDASH